MMSFWYPATWGGGRPQKLKQCCQVLPLGTITHVYRARGGIRVPWAGMRAWRLSQLATVTLPPAQGQSIHLLSTRIRSVTRPSAPGLHKRSRKLRK